MERGMKDSALGVAVALENLQVPDHGNLGREKQGRLVKVLGELLEFLSESKAREWMLKENHSLRGKKPIDLVGSEYATEDLLLTVREMRGRYRSERSKARLRRLLRDPSVLEPHLLKYKDIPVELL